MCAKNKSRPFHPSTLLLLIFGSVILVVCLGITLNSDLFDDTFKERPILEVLCGLALATVCYLLACAVVFRWQSNRDGFAIVVALAVVFRILLIFSIPFQEIDLYRYIWDGNVSKQGVSPFAYSPDQVKLAIADKGNSTDLNSLAQLSDNDESLRFILSEIHFSDLPTVYPSTSQAVFFLAANTTPKNASVITHLRIMKSWIVLFDLGTLLILILLLKFLRLPVRYCIVYAWCPLVLKEFANSGHLDSIAVFFVTLAFYLFLFALRLRYSAFHQSLLLTATAIAIALGIGAKLYPIILTPLLATVTIRKLGWKCVILPLLIVATLAPLLVWPLIPWSGTSSKSDTARDEQTIAKVDSADGMREFLQTFEMNDFLFMILIENFKTRPTPDSDQTEPWFSVLPESTRETVQQFAIRMTGAAKDQAPFVATQLFIVSAFLILAVVFAILAARLANPETILMYAFLTIAWFWLLSPTQNPWYWTWAIPFLVFARNWLWYLISGLALIYYMRFWFEYHFGIEVWGTEYRNVEYFDYVVTWFEFAPWFLLLILSNFLPKRWAKNNIGQINDRRT